jgi:hypothetical protein
MSDTRTRSAEQRLGTIRDVDELPPLSTADRLALRLGLALLLWSRRHVDREERAEHARRSDAAACAARSRDTALTRRHHAGPTW